MKKMTPQNRTARPMASANLHQAVPAVAHRRTLAQEQPGAHGAQPGDHEAEEDLENDEEDQTKTWLRLMPAGLTSMVFHVVGLLILALWVLKASEDVQKKDLLVNNEPPPEIEEPEPEIDLPPQPEPDDTVDEATSEVEPTDLPSVEPLAGIEIADLPASPNAPIEIALPTNIGALSNNDVIGPPVGSSTVGSGSLDGFRTRAKSRAPRAAISAVDRSLKWIVAHQLRDGSWGFRLNDIAGCNCRNSGTKGRIGATSMALLPILGYGITHQKGKYKKEVQRGLEFLKRKMKKPDGSLWEPRGEMYSHGLAAIVLCEAYAMTEDSRLRPYAEAALRYIIAAQDKAGGGWRYKPGQPGDTSIFGWILMALKSGEMAKLHTPKEVYQLASKFLDSVSSDSGTYYGYTSPGRGNATSAIGHLCRMYLGAGKEDPAVMRGVEWISAKGPSWQNMYYNYYATQLIHHHGGEHWKQWNDKMLGHLVKTQATAGHEAGSWMFAGGDHGYKAGGRLYTTSMATMMLEVYYRHMPLYQQGAIALETIGDTLDD